MAAVLLGPFNLNGASWILSEEQTPSKVSRAEEQMAFTTESKYLATAAPQMQETG